MEADKGMRQHSNKDLHSQFHGVQLQICGRSKRKNGAWPSVLIVRLFRIGMGSPQQEVPKGQRRVAQTFENDLSRAQPSADRGGSAAAAVLSLQDPFKW